MHLKSLFKDSLIYSISDVLTKAIGIFLVPLYTRILHPGDYGVVELISVTGSLVVVVASLQITQSVGRFFPAADSKSEATSIASTALFFTLFIYVILLIVTQYFSGKIWTILVNDSQAGEAVVRLAFLSIVITGPLYFLQNQLKWQRKAGKHAITSVTFSLVTIVCTFYFVLYLKLGVSGIFSAQVIGGMVGSILAFYFSRASYSLRFDISRLGYMLNYSVPLVVAASSVLILRVLDRFVINGYLSLDDLGIYSIGAKFSSILLIIFGAIQNSLTPRIFASYHADGTSQSIEKAFRIVFSISIFLIVSMSIFSNEILLVLTAPAYYGASTVIPFLLASAALFSLTMFAPGLHISKKTSRIALIHFTVAILAVILSITLIKIFGLVGVACASMLASAVLFVWRFAESERHYHIPYRWGFVIYLSILAAVIIYLSYHYLDTLAIEIFLAKVILLAGFIFLVYRSGIFPGEERQIYLGKMRRFVTSQLTRIRHVSK